MNQRNAPTREMPRSRAYGRLARAGLALLLAVAVQMIPGANGVESAPPPSPTPTVTTTEEVESTPSPTATRAPTATPSPTPAPVQDLAVVFFNNFCELGQPLLATVFNTSATPLKGRTLHVKLSSESGVLEEHDHYLDLQPLASVNLPLANVARPPWVKIEISLRGSPADPNPNNDSSSCGVAAPATVEPDGPATAGGRISGASGGSTADAAWRQAGTSPTQQAIAQVQPTRAPSRAQTNSPQPSLTPIGSAGGGLASQSEGGFFASRTLTLLGVVFLTGGSSWAFYYLTRPPKNA